MNESQSQFANGDSSSYWNAVRKSKLEFQQCQTYENVQFPTRHLCTGCWSDEVSSLEATGNGTIESLTVVRRAPLKQFREQTPYVLVSVICEEGPRMITHLVGDGAFSAKIGYKVVFLNELIKEGALRAMAHIRRCGNTRASFPANRQRQHVRFLAKLSTCSG